MAENKVELTLLARDQASQVIRGVMSSISGLLGQLTALAGIGGAGAMFAGMVKEGIGFQKMLEDSRIAIAGVVGALHTYRDASGNVIQGEAAWAAALADSAAIQEQLRTAALTTTATYQEMVEAFTTGVGPMSRAGIALGHTAEATQRLTQVAAAASIPMAQLAVEIRQFFAGDEMRSRLLQTLQITKEQIEEHKKLGDMMEFLREKTASYARAAQAATTSLTGSWSNLKDAIQQTLGIGMEPLFSKLKESLGAIAAQFVSFGKDSKGNLTAQFSPEVVSRVQAIAETLGQALDRFKELVPAVIDFGLALAQHASKAIELLSHLPLKPILTLLSDLTVATNGWGLAFLGVGQVVATIKFGELTGLAAIAGMAGSAWASVSLVFVELQARIIAATFASTGLAAGLAGAATAGLFGALIAEIGLLVYTVKLAADEARELELVAQSNAKSADTMLSNISRWQERFKAVATGPMTKEQFELKDELGKLEEWVTKIKSLGGVIDEKTMAAFKKLGSSVKDLLPPLAQVTRETNGIGDGASEARQKWEEFARKVEDKAILAHLDGVAKKIQETKNAILDASAEAKKAAAAAGADPSGILKKISQTEWLKFAKDFKAQPAEIVATWDYELNKIPDHVKTYFTKAGTVAVETVDQWRNKLRSQVEELLSGAFAWDGVATVAQGVEAGWLSVLAAMPTAAESAATAVQGIWAGMARSFDDLFFNVLSGRLDNLKDVFKNLWESLLQSFSRYLSDMLQRWIATQVKMEGTAAQGSYPGVSSSYPWGGGGGGGGWGKALGFLGAGATGYGIGGMIGPGGAGNTWGGAVGAVGGLAVGSMAGVISGVGSALGLGAAAGSVVPIIGTIVGALIGAIIGGLFNKNTERSMTGSLGGMVGATRWDREPIFAPREPGAFGPRGTEGDYGEPVIVGYRDVSSLETPRTAFEREGQRGFRQQAATLADIFRTGAKDQAGELLAAYQNALKESLSGAWFKISAGSQEDIEKDAEILLTRLLPRIGLSAAFGQTGYLPHGDRDATGGIPGINWGMPGMDESGAWTGAKQLFDPEAPIPKMLAGLGFTADKIGELAGRISTDDPAKLLEYIQGIVGVVVGLRELGAEMGKSFSELAKGWKEEAGAGPAAAFGKQAQEIADAFGALSLYSGDEQLQKAQEALGLSDQFWENVEGYLRQVQASIEKMSASLQSQRSAMRDFLNPLGADEGAANAWGTVSGVWGKLANAVDPAVVEQAVAEAQAAIDKVFQIMAERVTRGNALLERLGALGADLADLSNLNPGADTLASNPIAVMGEQLVDIQKRVTAAAQLSGIAQIDAIEGVAQSAEEMAANLRNLFAEIASVSASINKSIDSQIWELGVGEMDATGQASAITQRVKELQDQLAIATSPAEIQALVSEIQSLTGRYVGQFGQDDAKRDEAIAWAQEQLERARGLANESLEILRKQAEEQAAALQEILKGAATDIAGNVTEASGIIGQLSHTLGELDRVMQETMGRLGDGILASLEPLRLAMEGAAGIFTGATQTAGDALTVPTTGLADSTDRAAASTRAFADNLDRAIPVLARLAALGGPGGGQAPNASAAPPPASQSASVDARAVIPLVRRYAFALTPRTY